MGRTLLPFRPALERELATWQDYRRGLQADDRLIFDELANMARQHADAGSLAGRPLLSEVIYFSIAIEHQKSLNNLMKQLTVLVKRLDILETRLFSDLSPSS